MTSKLYFAEEFELIPGDETCKVLLTTTGIDEETANKLLDGNSVMRAVFRNGRLVSKDVGDWGGDWNPDCQDDDEIGFPLPANIPLHTILQFNYAESGLHTVGGPAPSGFQMPTHPDLPVSTQFIASISGQEEAFSWLPMETLHLAFPLFVSVGPLFLDYSNPMKPEIIELQFYEHTFPCVNKHTLLEYEPLSFVLTPLPSEYDPDHFGNTGVPRWIQHPEHPRCPKSGRIMQFLLQMDCSQAKIVKKEGVGPEDEHLQGNLDTLNFWGGGMLFVFVEPKTSMVCMLIQNT